MILLPQRMNRYSASETHFALLSIGEQKKSVLELGISALSSRLSALDLVVTTGDGKSSVLPDGFVFADSTDGLAEQRGATIAALDNLKVELDIENEKLRRQKEENVRRRHNYIPMAVSLLRHLAAKGKLSGLISSANDRRALAVANKMKNKA
jgi:ubiquitin carboxyl-terminal hydrolase L5